MGYTNSPLVEYVLLSPNNSGMRGHKIDRITPHCVVGQCTAEGLGEWFVKESTHASSNYGIDRDGRVGMYVEERNRSWCTSSSANDHRAITIECASDKVEPYTMYDVVFERLIDLCTDICRRYNKTKLLWIENKDKSLSYEPADDEMLITVHRWFANKSCPGEWLYSRLGKLATEVTKRLGSGEVITPAKPKEISYGMATLKKGSTGIDVTIYESIMKKIGYYAGKIDTTFGSGCLAACDAFQKDYPECGTNGKPDGAFGPKCWKKLFSLLKV